MISTVGVNEPETEPDIRIFPNPVKSGNVVIISNVKDMRQASLFSIEGKLMKNFDVRIESQNYNIGNLAPGLYLVRLETASGEVLQTKLSVY